MFYLAVILLFLLTPIVLSAKGFFDMDKRIVTIVLRLYGIKILCVKLYLSDDGISFSVNGKQGKQIEMKHNGTLKRFDPIAAMRIRRFIVSVAVGGDPFAISVALGSVLSAANAVFDHLRSRGILDHALLRVVPRYSGDKMSVNFSIKILSSVAMACEGLIHTNRGERR